MLLSDTYQLYVSDIIKLVRSFVIKSEQTVININAYLTAGGDTLSLDPMDWKYYRNLAGERYVGSSGLNDDPVITVYSLDTDSVIPFTVASLADNPVTLADLRTYGATYNTLLALYPNYDMLIRGVLAPVDINTAIEADNYTILGFDSTYLGTGELSLISDIQTWLNGFSVRWDVHAFAISDALYPATILGIMYLQLVPVIINLRFRNCKTAQAHEFHIWNYLGGYYHLSKYKDIIPYEQALWLYRNIDYVTANAGKGDTLDFLNDSFAFPYGLQLYSHEVRQCSGNALANLNNQDYTNLGNKVMVNMYPYGTSDQLSLTENILKPVTLVNKLKSQAVLNPANVEYDTEDLVNSTLLTPNTRIPTGVIECDIIKNATVNMVSVVNEKIHNWFYLTANGYIKYKYLLTLPSENINGILLNAHDAAALLLYASAAWAGNVLTDIPSIMVRDIMYHPSIPLVDIKGVIEESRWTGHLGYAVPYIKTWDRYADLSSVQTYPINLLSLKAFNTYIDKVVTNKVLHRLYPTLEPDTIGRSELEALVRILYTNYTCTFVAETNYTDLFNRLELDLSTFNQDSLYEFMTLIFNGFMAITPDLVTLQSPYAEMVEILRTVCSYTLEFVNGIGTNNIEPIDWVVVNPTMPHWYIINSKILIPCDYDLNIIDRLTIQHVDLRDRIKLNVTDTQTQYSCVSGSDITVSSIMSDFYRVDSGAFPNHLDI